MAFLAFNFLCLVFMFYVPGSKSEVFTALVDLKQKLFNDQGVLSVLETYMDSEYQRMLQIRKLIHEYRNISKQIHESHIDAEVFLSNPVNAYLVVKRLTRDWDSLISLIKYDTPAQNFKDSLQGVAGALPSEEDLEGAVDALLRLQDTYKLDSAVIAGGRIQGAKSLQTLNAGDCFELGRQTYVKADHYHTVIWMQEALQRYENEVTKTAVKSDILEYLAYSSFMQGNTRLALKLTKQLLEVVPDHDRAAGNIHHYEHLLREDRKSRRRGDDGELTDATVSLYKKPTDGSDYLREREKYERLCRYAEPLAPRRVARLKCRLFTNDNHPLLVLSPAKLEEAFDVPRIARFHDVISDAEIAVVKRLATPRLQRATARNQRTGRFEPAHYRISKSAWLGRGEHPAVRRLFQRVAALTSLDMASSEDLQVVNYGLGGHYEPHFDFARDTDEPNAFSVFGRGNRVATLLLYLSDVEAGGATVFPEAGARLRPERGSAVLWWNLRRSGAGDLTTRHAGCPVLAGSKWVANFWVHEHGQEFTRPCGLTPDD